MPTVGEETGEVEITTSSTVGATDNVSTGALVQAAVMITAAKTASVDNSVLILIEASQQGD
jgi:hypothetical protein